MVGAQHRQLQPFQRGARPVYQIGWNSDNPDLLNRYYSGERSSLSAWATDNQLQAEFASGALQHRVTLGAEYHRYKMI